LSKLISDQQWVNALYVTKQCCCMHQRLTFSFHWMNGVTAPQCFCIVVNYRGNFVSKFCKMPLFCSLVKNVEIFQDSNDFY
jgi:hypothetical protein